MPRICANCRRMSFNMRDHALCRHCRRRFELRCTNCDYDLQGLAPLTKCPECGTPFDAAVAARSLEHRRAARWIIGTIVVVVLLMAANVIAIRLVWSGRGLTPLALLSFWLPLSLVGVLMLIGECVGRCRTIPRRSATTLGVGLVLLGAGLGASTVIWLIWAQAVMA